MILGICPQDSSTAPPFSFSHHNDLPVRFLPTTRIVSYLHIQSHLVGVTDDECGVLPAVEIEDVQFALKRAEQYCGTGFVCLRVTGVEGVYIHQI